MGTWLCKNWKQGRTLLFGQLSSYWVLVSQSQTFAGKIREANWVPGFKEASIHTASNHKPCTTAMFCWWVERIAVFLNYGQNQNSYKQTTTVQKQKQVKNINGQNLNAIVITLVCALENKQDVLDQAITNIFIYIWLSSHRKCEIEGLFVQ